jgi:hypothetical protein
MTPDVPAVRARFCTPDRSPSPGSATTRPVDHVTRAESGVPDPLIRDAGGPGPATFVSRWYQGGWTYGSIFAHPARSGSSRDWSFLTDARRPGGAHDGDVPERTARNPGRPGERSRNRLTRTSNDEERGDRHAPVPHPQAVRPAPAGAPRRSRPRPPRRTTMFQFIRDNELDGLNNELGISNTRRGMIKRLAALGLVTAGERPSRRSPSRPSPSGVARSTATATATDRGMGRARSWTSRTCRTPGSRRVPASSSSELTRARWPTPIQ